MQLATLSWGFPIVVAQGSGGAIVLLVMVPVAIFLLVRATESLSRQLLIKHTPTSQCGDLSPGLVELKATVVADEPLASPLTDESVVYFEYGVEEKVNQSSNKTTWREVSEASAQMPFYLRDDTGRVRVDPDGATWHPASVVDEECSYRHSLYDRGPAEELPNSRQWRRFHESHIAVGSEVYIMGTARDRASLGIPEIGAGPPERPFIISTRDESDLVKTHFNRAVWQFGLGGSLAASVPVFATMIAQNIGFYEAFFAALLPTFFVSLGVVGLIWGIYRHKHSQHLTDLKGRIKRAQQILRRECEHRRELIIRVAELLKPEVDPLEARKLDEWIAEHRNRSGSAGRAVGLRRISATIDEQSDDLEELFSILTRRHASQPDYQPSQRLIELLEELTRCEKQLLMARNFYNDGVRRLNQEPESAVGEAARTANDSMALMSFRPFEKKPVDVVLPEDPHSEYGGDFERQPIIDDAHEESDQRDRSSPSGPPPTPSGPPPTPSGPPPTPSGPPPTPSGPPDPSGDEASRPDGSQDAPDAGGSTVSHSQFGVTMQFGERTEFRSDMEFGEIGRFGAARRFDDLIADGGPDAPPARTPYGFGCDDAGREKPPARRPYGFDDFDRRSVNQAFDDE